MNRSVDFFESQFRQQIATADFALNPFEAAALPYLRGRVLDYGCGLGNLALAAARAGHPVLALDASPTAIRHLRNVAAAERLPIDAAQADLRKHVLAETFDSVVSIGLLMFFDCAAAKRQLADLQAAVRPGGVMVLNVLVEGTTFLDMFDPADHCLFPAEDLHRHFAGWTLLQFERRAFPAPGNRVKDFVTLIAGKPAA